MSAICTCLRGGPRDPHCPVSGVHEVLDGFRPRMAEAVADMREQVEELRRRTDGEEQP